MNWKNIKLSKNEKQFEYQSKPLWNKVFINAMKFHEPGFAPVEDNTGWYHIDYFGNQLYNERYTRAFGFYCNRAAIVNNDKCFHITEKGERAYKNQFAWTGNFQENICTVRNFDKFYFHINQNGERIYTTNYLYAGDFKDGFACVKRQNGLFKHIDINGNYLNDNEFLDLNVFHKGFATAKDEKGWFHINKNGDEIYSERYQVVEPFYNGFALVTKFDNQKIIIDEQGIEILEV